MGDGRIWIEYLEMPYPAVLEPRNLFPKLEFTPILFVKFEI